MTTTQFEDRLLAELREVVSTQSASGELAVPRRRRAPRLLLGGAATAAVAATVLLAVAGGDGTAPAFALDRQPDGSVTVTINRLSDAAGLQAQLRAAGIAAVVDYTPFGKACREPRGRPAAPPPVGASVSGSSSTGHSASFTVSRKMVSVGQTLVIMTSGGTGPSSVGMEVIQGPVSPCQLVDAPAPSPAGARLSTHRPLRGTSSGTESRSLHTVP
jgi:hypothetical protein